MQNLTALAGVLVALAAVIFTPWFTARQGHKHWLRELRMGVYSALMRDVYAEMRHIARQVGRPALAAVPRAVEEREAPELAEIMGRMHVVASSEVRDLMSKFYGIVVDTGTPVGLSLVDSLRESDRLLSALDTQIREETGADHIKLGPRRLRLPRLRTKHRPVGRAAEDQGVANLLLPTMDQALARP